MAQKSENRWRAGALCIARAVQGPFPRVLQRNPLSVRRRFSRAWLAGGASTSIRKKAIPLSFCPRGAGGQWHPLLRAAVLNCMSPTGIISLAGAPPRPVHACTTHTFPHPPCARSHGAPAPARRRDTTSRASCRCLPAPACSRHSMHPRLHAIHFISNHATCSRRQHGASCSPRLLLVRLLLRRTPATCQRRAGLHVPPLCRPVHLPIIVFVWRFGCRQQGRAHLAGLTPACSLAAQGRPNLPAPACPPVPPPAAPLSRLAPPLPRSPLVVAGASTPASPARCSISAAARSASSRSSAPAAPPLSWLPSSAAALLLPPAGGAGPAVHCSCSVAARPASPFLQPVAMGGHSGGGVKGQLPPAALAAARGRGGVHSPAGQRSTLQAARGARVPHRAQVASQLLQAAHPANVLQQRRARPLVAVPGAGAEHGTHGQGAQCWRHAAPRSCIATAGPLPGSWAAAAALPHAPLCGEVELHCCGQAVPLEPQPAQVARNGRLLRRPAAHQAARLRPAVPCACKKGGAVSRCAPAGPGSALPAACPPGMQAAGPTWHHAAHHGPPRVCAARGLVTHQALPEGQQKEGRLSVSACLPALHRQQQPCRLSPPASPCTHHKRHRALQRRCNRRVHWLARPACAAARLRPSTAARHHGGVGRGGGACRKLRQPPSAAAQLSHQAAQLGQRARLHYAPHEGLVLGVPAAADQAAGQKRRGGLQTAVGAQTGVTEWPPPHVSGGKLSCLSTVRSGSHAGTAAPCGVSGSGDCSGSCSRSCCSCCSS